MHVLIRVLELARHQQFFLLPHHNRPSASQKHHDEQSLDKSATRTCIHYAIGHDVWSPPTWWPVSLAMSRFIVHFADCDLGCFHDGRETRVSCEPGSWFSEMHKIEGPLQLLELDGSQLATYS